MNIRNYIILPSIVIAALFVFLTSGSLLNADSHKTSTTTMTRTGDSMEISSQNVPGAPNEICPLKLGSEVPSVNVHDLNGNPVNLTNLLAGKNTALIFYRGGW